MPRIRSATSRCPTGTRSPARAPTGRSPRCGPAPCLGLEFGSGALVLATDLPPERRDGSLLVVADLAAVRARRERAAVAVLTAIAQAEERCRGLCAVDADHDHQGEYGTFGQL